MDRHNLHRFSFNRVNFSILLPAVLLVSLGLATFYSIDARIFKQQFIFLLLSLFAYFVFLNIDYRIFALRSKYLYIIMVGLLLVLFLIGIEAKGATRWIDVFGIRIQFSEVIKPFFIIFMAEFLSKNNSRSFSKFIKSLILLLPIFFLTLKQPDLGNALIYLSTTVFILFVYGFPLRYFLALGGLAAVLGPILFNFLHDYQKLRIINFINPTSDPFGSSYNAIQSLISIGSGGLTGKGFGQATQSILKFLPERHTDFIFATITESLGFLGGIVLLSIFTFLMFRIYKISQDVSDSFSHLVLMGYYFLFLTHIFFNVGMNIGLVPIVGITLPFVSYGGSSLLTNFVILGIISSVTFDFRKKNSLEIR